MRQIIIGLVLLTVTTACATSDTRNDQQIKNLENITGITHYGMNIDEIVKEYKQDLRSLEIVYSKNLSDDNMDDYVKRFYDELLLQIEKWLDKNTLEASNTKIVISNCKFCKIGYCKKKNIKEVRLDSYKNNKAFKHLVLTHDEIIDRTKYADMARSSVVILLEK